MVRIAPVNLYFNPKTLWFDAGELEVRAGDGVVVSTARGVEFGRAANDAFEADAAQVKKLKTPLKPVKRIATEEDEAQAAEMERLSAEALPVFKQMAAEADADMHPVSVEYLFDGDKAIFYFEAEERVDFRDLVRKLASKFRVRVDMRQIGVRDEARMVGGLGHCGQELCCKRMGGEFCPVSIRMAKEQDLSLNPQKISGVCGRLMCCLRYEFDAYKDFKSRAPKQNSQVETPAGTAKVVDLDVPREIVSLKIEGEKPVKVPLAAFDPPEEGNRPKRVGEEAWEEANAASALAIAGEGGTLLTSQLTGQDKLADPKAVRRTGKSGQKQARGNGGNGGGSGRGGRGGAASGKAPDAQATSGRKPRRRRSTKVGGEAAEQAAEGQKPAQRQKGAAQKSGQGPAGRKGGQGGQKKRPGQAAAKQGAPAGGDQQQKKRPGQKPAGASKQGPRPGQRSSGLRQGQKPAAAGQGAQPGRGGADAPRPDGARAEGGGHRRARRRSHKAGGADGKGSGAAGGGASGGADGKGGAQE